VDIISHFVLVWFSAGVKGTERLLRCQHPSHVYFSPYAAQRLVELVGVLLRPGVLPELPTSIAPCAGSTAFLALGQTPSAMGCSDCAGE
jgi:hypothetical protein